VRAFNGRVRAECLNGEIFYTLKEAKIVIEAWRRHYNTVRPHSSLGYPRQSVLASTIASSPSAMTAERKSRHVWTLGYPFFLGLVLRNAWNVAGGFLPGFLFRGPLIQRTRNMR
jgi:hypothetical protein